MRFGLAAALVVALASLTARPGHAAEAGVEFASWNAEADAPSAIGAGAERAANASLEQALAENQERFGADSLPVAAAADALANDYSARSQFALALPLYQRSLAIRVRQLGDEHPLVASGLTSLAKTFIQVGESAYAQTLAQRGVNLSEKLYGADDPRYAESLAVLATAQRELGRYDEALALGQRSLAIYEKSRGPASLEVAKSLSQLGQTCNVSGRYAQALEAWRRSLAIREQTLGPDHSDVALGLTNLATLYTVLGQRAEAVPLLERSLKIDERNFGPVHGRVAVALADLAHALCGVHRCQEALPLALRSVQIFEQLGNPDNRRLAASLDVVASVYRALGRDADARPLLERELAIREKVQGSGHPDVAGVLRNLAALEWKQGRHDQARELLLRALPIAAHGDQPETLWRVQSLLRTVYAGAGERDQAIYWGKAAVNTIQSMRASLRDIDLEAQHSFLDDRRGAYNKLAALLIDAGRLGEAEQILAMLKDQELTQLVHRGADVRPKADLVGPERLLDQQYARMVDEGIGRARELDTLERRARYETLSEADEARRQQLQEEATEWREKFQKWLVSLQTSLVAGANSSGSPVEPISRQEIAQESTALQTMVRSDPGAVGLYYVVTDEQLSVIIATSRGSFGRQIDIGAVELNRRVEALRLALADPMVDPRPAAAQLYQVLIEPIAADLGRAQAHTLVLSLTDNLRYVPFAALYDGRKYLIERYAIGQIVAGAPQRTDGRRRQWQISAFGMTRAAGPLPALPGVREELESIVLGQDHSGGVLAGTINLDNDFDRRHLEAALHGNHRVVHIGSHFVLTPGSEESSFLLLGDGSHLSLDEIATLDFAEVDLLTLSACDTAKGGGVDDNGAEVEGLATIVARQGAASVLASLWPVNDRSTASLMHYFYEGRLGGGSLTRAQALQRAQLALLRGAVAPTSASGLAAQETDLAAAVLPAQALPSTPGAGSSKGGKVPTAATTAFGIDQTRPYAHPYYWAPFVLMGSWL
jgi:CHAT domain-containing protein